MAAKTETKTETKAEVKTEVQAEVKAEVKTETQAAIQPKNNSVVTTEKSPAYSVSELTENHHVFNTSPDIVKAALSLDGKKEKYTLDEAKAIVNAFMTKEVK